MTIGLADKTQVTGDEEAARLSSGDTQRHPTQLGLGVRRQAALWDRLREVW